MISIYPRYSRRNRRYKIKVSKEKVPIEKRLLRQSAISTMLLAIFVVISLFYPAGHIADSLNKSYTPAMWKKAAFMIGDRIAHTSGKAVNGYLSFVNSVTGHIGIDKKTSPEAVTAKADEKEAPAITELPDIEEKEKERVWSVPVHGEITSDYGSRIHPIENDETLHTGIDIGAPEGECIVSTSDGTVKKIGADEANGNYIVIEHGDGFTSVYAHLKKICVSVGERVSPEIKIGEVGSTGISTGPHLHFEIKLNGESVNPRDYVHFDNQVGGAF